MSKEKRSSIWKHFNLSSSYGECLTCGKQIKKVSGGATGNFLRHLRSCSPGVFANMKNSKETYKHPEQDEKENTVIPVDVDKIQLSKHLDMNSTDQECVLQPKARINTIKSKAAIDKAIEDVITIVRDIYQPTTKRLIVDLIKNGVIEVLTNEYFRDPLTGYTVDTLEFVTALTHEGFEIKPETGKFFSGIFHHIPLKHIHNEKLKDFRQDILEEPLSSETSYETLNTSTCSESINEASEISSNNSTASDVTETSENSSNNSTASDVTETSENSSNNSTASDVTETSENSSNVSTASDVTEEESENVSYNPTAFEYDPNFIIRMPVAKENQRPGGRVKYIPPPLEKFKSFFASAPPIIKNGFSVIPM